MNTSILTVFDDNGNAIPIPAIKGEPGSDYVLTDADKQEIAELAASLVPSGGTALCSLLKDITLKEDSKLSITDFDTSLNEYHVLVGIPVTTAFATNIKMFGSMGVDYYLSLPSGNRFNVLSLSYYIFADGIYRMERDAYLAAGSDSGPNPEEAANMPHTAPATLNNQNIRSGLFKFSNRSSGLASSATFPAGTRSMIWGR